MTSQSDLKHVIGEEIGTQAWVAPPEDFIRMISPKKIKDGVDVYRKHWSLEEQGNQGFPKAQSTNRG